MVASTPFHHLLSGLWAPESKWNQTSLSPSLLSSPSRRPTTQDGYSSPACHCPPGAPKVPLDPEVSPGASRSRPEIVQVTHPPSLKH